MTHERRSERRCLVASDEIQVAVTGSSRTCILKDISRKGVKIEYGPVADESFESRAIDILSVRFAPFYLHNIACETVYDIPTLMQDRHFKGGEMRMRGLKFVSLTGEQEDRLGILINRCLSGSS